jgi:hypothetical protein
MVPANREKQQDQPPQGFGSGTTAAVCAARAFAPAGPATGARKKFPAALARTLEPGTPPEIFANLFQAEADASGHLPRVDYC